MSRKQLLVAASVLIAVAAVLFTISKRRESAGHVPAGVVRAGGVRFLGGGRPFRFVGANVAVMYRDEDRARMPETLRQAAQMGVKVVRVWASGEGGPNDVKPIGPDANDWPPSPDAH